MPLRRLLASLALPLLACSPAAVTDAGPDGRVPDDTPIGIDSRLASDVPVTGDGPVTDVPITSDTARTDVPIASDVPVMPGTLAERRRRIAMTLRGNTQFMTGLGNDLRGAPDYNHELDGVYPLGTAAGHSLDIHYAYLTGFSDRGGWPTWNTGGSFVNILADPAQRHGVTPMFTYYAMALELENGVEALHDDAIVHQYLLDVKLMYQRLAMFGRPAIAHFEPDFWGYLQTFMARSRTTPDTYTVRTRFTDFHDCDALAQTAHGFGQCLVHMARTIAPQVMVAFQASTFGDGFSSTDPSVDLEAKARSVAAFLRAMGADETDFIVVETLDRDAGFWETHSNDTTRLAACTITGGPRGGVYWDEANVALPNYRQHFRWVSALTTALALPALWWQTPMGVPAATCGGVGGGTDGHYRDNHVHYFFSHVNEMIAAGGMGVAFGTGAGRQTYITTDGDQLRDAVRGYYMAPVALP